MTLEILRLAADADGIADDGTHIARTLPGEHVEAQLSGQARRARLLGITQPSPQRITPACPHFTQNCGGCALQHWEDAAYAGWKAGQVAAALRRAGYTDLPTPTLIRTPPGARRRMDFATERTEGSVLLGLHALHGKDIVDLQTCPVLHPVLAALIAPLRPLLKGLAALRRRGSVIANLLADGPDLLIRTDGPLAPTDRAKLAAFAATHGVRRIAWALNAGPPETAAMQAQPHLLFAGHRVEPPPGAFLQASAEGEAAIVAAVLAALPAKLTGKSRAIELFAGCGTISFPLAAHLRVLAYEGDAAAAASVRRAQTGSRVEMTQRNLARQPLSAKELTGAAMIVLDPPYAGAPEQMEAIAASRVGTLAYVSCNPGALGRDAAALHKAGYALAQLTVIDQFLWSAQVECVAVFRWVGPRPTTPANPPVSPPVSPA